MQVLKKQEASSTKDDSESIIEIKTELPEHVTARDIVEANVELRKDAMTRIAQQTKADIRISTSVAKLVFFNNKAVASISDQAKGSDVKITAKVIAKPELPDAVQKAVGTHPVYDFSVISNKYHVSDFNGGTVTISIPYALDKGENPQNIVVNYMDDNGYLVLVKNSMYDEKTQTVIF